MLLNLVTGMYIDWLGEKGLINHKWFTKRERFSDFFLLNA